MALGSVREIALGIGREWEGDSTREWEGDSKRTREAAEVRGGGRGETETESECVESRVKDGKSEGREVFSTVARAESG